MVKKKELKNGPIGIFDSGMGGLTVLDAVRKRFPSEDLIYFGDTAHLPYGNKSPDSIIKYSLLITEFFKSRNVKLMVVACNTASVYALDVVREKAGFPVVGVVESGVRAAMQQSCSSVAVIGTYGTIKSGAYEKKIRLNNARARIYSRPCPLFVPLVEEGWTDHPVTREVAEIYLSDFKNRIESIILACTHYPLLKNVIAKVLGDKVNIVDSATEVAKEVEDYIDAAGSGDPGISEGVSEFYVSDAPELFMEQSRLFLGYTVDKVGKLETD